MKPKPRRNAAIWCVRTCENCGIAFNILRKRIRQGRGRFCSRHCSGVAQTKRANGFNGSGNPSWQGGPIKRTCAQCGISFNAKKANVKKGWGKFCSAKCRILSMAGPEHPGRTGSDLTMAQYTSWYVGQRRLKLKAKGRYTPSEIKNIYIQQAGKCAICKKDLNHKYHIDHIMPVSKGGSNWPNNLQVLCPKCNLKKHAKHPLEFLVSQGILIP